MRSSNSPRPSGRRRSRVCAALLCAVLLSACASGTQETPVATPGSVPTRVAIVQAVPTVTLLPTVTLIPATATPQPSPSPVPTRVQPTATAGPPTVRYSTLSAVFGALTSSRNDIAMTLDGVRSDGVPVNGSLNAVAIEDFANKKRWIELSGPLLLQVLPEQAQLLNPSAIGIYRIDAATFVRLDGFFQVCAKPGAAAALSDGGLSLEAYLPWLGGDNAARVQSTTPLAEENVAGVTSRRYALDVGTINAALRASGDPSAIVLSRGEIWLAAGGGYVTRLKIEGAGDKIALAGQTFKGKFSLDVTVRDVNAPVQIELPRSCARPIEI
jgi:hypothetical protein